MKMSRISSYMSSASARTMNAKGGPPSTTRSRGRSYSPTASMPRKPTWPLSLGSRCQPSTRHWPYSSSPTESAKLLRKIQTPSARKPKELSRRYDLVGGQGITGALREWDAAGKVTLDLVIENPLERAQFVEDIRKRFGAKAAEIEPESKPNSD